jgi:diguanylate cyclase (GGDEF)-like protein
VGQVYDDEIENMNPEQAKQRLEDLEKWVGDFEIKVSGAYSCWQNRVLITHNIEDSTMISVPILSQGLIIGVLCAEYVGLQNNHAFSQDLRKIHNLLLDYGRNIGQPLKKEELYEQAIKDAMTGLFNKAHYESQLHENFHRTRRYNRDLTFIFLDIDHFKNINDTYGHLTGDIALKSVAKILKDNIRQTDTAFRIGGEELCVLLPESGHEEGLSVAEKLREVIEFTEFPTDQNFTIRFTASFGVASLTADMTKPDQLVKAADEAVYKAKKTGRNKVISARDMVEK